jgi:hypothetical protein
MNQAQTIEPVGFVAACKQFFGFLPDQTLMTFRDECNRLSPQDKAEIREGLIQNGINVKPL